MQEEPCYLFKKRKNNSQRFPESAIHVLFLLGRNAAGGGLGKRSMWTSAHMSYAKQNLLVFMVPGVSLFGCSRHILLLSREKMKKGKTVKIMSSDVYLHTWLLRDI